MICDCKIPVFLLYFFNFWSSFLGRRTVTVFILLVVFMHQIVIHCITLCKLRENFIFYA